MAYTLQQIKNMDPFEKSEITCRRAFNDFKSIYCKDKKDLIIKKTPSGTIYDAKMTYTDSEGKLHKCIVEFKFRESLYDEMFIEPKNVTLAINSEYEYLYINFYDNKFTKQRHMYVWSSYILDFQNLNFEMKNISKTNVKESAMQYQKRYKLSLLSATEHHIKDITELWQECNTEEYMEQWRKEFFGKK